MTSRPGLRAAGRHRRSPRPADLAERNIRTTLRERWPGAVGWTLSIANGRAPAGGHGPIGPWSSCRSSRPSRGRRHRRSGTSRTDGDNQARRPRDLAYLWVVEHGGAGSGSRPCETAACSAAAGCRVDRLRPDKPGRLHRSRPQARTAGQAGIGRVLALRPGEVFVLLDVTKHAELKRDRRGARPAHHPEWEQPSRRRILWKSSWSSSSPSSFLESPSGRCWPYATLRRPTSSPRGADPAGESSKEPDASESSIESPTPRHTEDQP